MGPRSLSHFLVFFVDITVEEFFAAPEGLESRYTRLKRVLSEVMQTDEDNVHVFSVANSSRRARELSVWFAAHGSPYYKPEKLTGNLAAHKAKVTALLTPSH